MKRRREVKEEPIVRSKPQTGGGAGGESLSRKRAKDAEAAEKRAKAAADDKEFLGELERGLNEDQLRALHLVQGRRNIFISGPGGSGKSHLLSVLKRWAAYKKLQYAVTATTGVAALNVGGVTLHSWAGVGYGEESVDFLLAKIRASGKGKNRYGSPMERWSKTQILFVDEVSMLSSDLFHKLDQIGRALRFRPLVSFGGLQIVLLGDFLQLPPVERDSNNLNSAYLRGRMHHVHHHHHHHHHHQHDDNKKEAAAAVPSPEEEKAKLAQKYLFFSESWHKGIHAVVLLRRVYRQTDDKFVSLLSRARMGELQPEDFRLLLSRVQADPMRRVKDKNGIEAPFLHSFRKAVERENMRCLEDIEGTLLRANRRAHYITVRRPPTTGAAVAGGVVIPPIIVMESIMRADPDAQHAAKKLGDTITAPDPILLKVGAVVMLLVNLDVRNKLVNGLRGIVRGTGPVPPPPTVIVPLVVAQQPMEIESDEKKTIGGGEGGGVEEATAADLAAAAAWRRKQRLIEDAEQDAEETGAPQEIEVLANDDEKIWVQFEGITDLVPISRYRWKHCLKDAERNLPEEQWSEYVQISQYPLTLAYASTIHKTQSLELTAAVLSLGEEVNAPGQAYTALSRIKSLEGVFVARLCSKAFQADPVTKQYYQLLAQEQHQQPNEAPQTNNANKVSH